MPIRSHIQSLRGWERGGLSRLRLHRRLERIRIYIMLVFNFIFRYFSAIEIGVRSLITKESKSSPDMAIIFVIGILSTAQEIECSKEPIKLSIKLKRQKN
jgi:hypothetical protein